MSVLRLSVQINNKFVYNTKRNQYGKIQQQQQQQAKRNISNLLVGF